MLKPLKIYFLVYFLSFSVLADDFIASVSKNKITSGESIELVLEYNGKTSEQPDLSVIKTEFEILSSSQSHESSYINGVGSQKTKWVLEIMALNDKANLVIPPISLGKYSTRPIIIQQSSAPYQNSQNQDLSLEAKLDRYEGYVNQEFILTINLRIKLALRQGNLPKPEIAGAIVETILESKPEEIYENGLKTTLVQRKYAIYPEKEGALLIPSLRFDGLVTDSSARGFFGRDKRVKAHSEKLSIKVKPVPNNFPKGEPFLPLKKLVVVESFDSDNPSFSVGEATPRRFEIKALGTLASFLPEIAPPTLPGLKIYSEPGVKANKATDEGIEASLNFSHVYMPSNGGAFTVPKKTIYWWDIEEDQLKETKIREFAFSVKGKSVSAAQMPKLENATESPKAADEININSSQNNFAAINSIWPWLCGLFGFLWLSTLVAWLYREKKLAQSKKNKVDEKAESFAKGFCQEIIKNAHEQSLPKLNQDLLMLKKLLGKEFLHEQEKIIDGLILKVEAARYGSKLEQDIKFKDEILTELKSMNWQPQTKSAWSEIYSK